MPRTPFNVLFVCLGNICRSPAAENIFRHQVEQAQLQDLIHIDSAGTLDFHTGKKPDRRMCQTLKKRSISSKGNARPFGHCDLKEFDLILTMDHDNWQQVSSHDPKKRFTEKIKRFSSFCRQPEHQIREVPDPYYGGDEGFEFVANMLEDGCVALLQHVKKELHQEES